MKTQDGAILQGVGYDIMQVESGIIKPPQKALDHELRARVPKGDYHVTMPVSIYTEALERKNIPISAATGPNPFSRTSGFTQPANQTKAVANWEGNVDFNKEKTQVNFMRVSGTNLSHRNPYMEKPVAFRNFDEIKREALKICHERTGNGLRGLRVFFKRMDQDGSGSIDPVEFKYAMRDFGLELSEIEVSEIVKHFDSNNDGKISFDEMITMLRGTLNDRRTRAVNSVFDRLDRLRSGSVELQVLERAYKPSNHPSVRSG
jgi:Ca2+-binding EF-hand superfamily protein